MTFRLNTYADILRDDRSKSDYDYQPADWKVIGSAWLQVTPKRADERIEGEQVKDVTTHKLYTRFNPKIEAGNRLRTNEQLFDVHGVVDIENRHEWSELTATEVTDG